MFAIEPDSFNSYIYSGLAEVEMFLYMLDCLLFYVYKISKIRPCRVCSN